MSRWEAEQDPIKTRIITMGDIAARGPDFARLIVRPWLAELWQTRDKAEVPPLVERGWTPGLWPVQRLEWRGRWEMLYFAATRLGEPLLDPEGGKYVRYWGPCHVEPPTALQLIARYVRLGPRIYV